MYVGETNPTWYIQKITKMRRQVELTTHAEDQARNLAPAFPAELILSDLPPIPVWVTELPKYVLQARVPDHPRSPPSL
jgi:hypothetical protein